MKTFVPIIAMLGLCQYVGAQVFYGNVSVFPQLTGTALRDSVILAYKPVYILNYNDARDTLYSSIYKLAGDSVECVYSGHRRHLTPGVDPSTDLAAGGSADGINLEHTFPQSMGASTGNPQSNMYHMFPSREAVNSARGNLPFGEIVDNQTNFWYIRNQTLTAIPGANIDGYSELLNNTRFEPREQHKGNVARAMMYFYTMYKAEADAANATFFESQRPTLCQWHMDDPVDSMEWVRNGMIARHQQNKRNPFILDCTLAKRLFCNTIILNSCSYATGVEEVAKSSINLWSNYPNPVTHRTFLYFDLAEAQNVRISIHNLLGEEITVLSDSYQSEGDHIQEWQPNDLPAGIYFAKIQAGNHIAINKIQVLK